MDNVKIEGWIPYKLTHVQNWPLCHWLDTGDAPFTEPFFDETIIKCRSANNKGRGFEQVSSLDMILDWAQDLDESIPNAFIFHISRCGSTLVSQLLASSSKNVSLAEVPFFDDLLRLPFKYKGFSEAKINGLLNAAIKYYSYKITANEKPGEQKAERLFIKADSWHIIFYAQLRRLFPEVPFILMYRSPDEVFWSHRKQAGMQAVPGLIEPELFGFTQDVIQQDAQVYLSNILAIYLDKYLETAANDANCLLINYSDGPMQMIDKIGKFANITFTKDELLNMDDRSQYHSKKPGERFNEAIVTGFPACLTNAMELYQILEKKRLTAQ